MHLLEALAQIGQEIDVPAHVLAAYADEDTIGGWDGGLGHWQCGSLWSVEGQFLYAVVRALKPQQVMEIGTHEGCSATHILAALEANGSGHLLSLDIWAGAGTGVPVRLKHRWTFVAAEAAQYIREQQVKADFVLEDALHDPEGTLNILQAVKDIVKPQVVISHDAAHPLVGQVVRNAFSTVFKRMDVALIDPGDCGLAWQVRGT